MGLGEGLGRVGVGGGVCLGLLRGVAVAALGLFVGFGAWV